MKIPASIRMLYEDQYVVNGRLKTEIDALINGQRNPRWHYESRVKELSSFALKVESGRFNTPSALEDFFACTIVVANAAEISIAEGLVKNNFEIKNRKPPEAKFTHKAPDAFPFDDLRLYVSLPHDETRPPSILTNVVFEIQVKTFLQHAWSIATHDLLYKTDDANWSKERIAYQIRAMLEHAEISIQEAEQLAACGTLTKEDDTTAKLKKGIALIKRQWSGDELPKDVRRLAANIGKLLSLLHIETERLEDILNQEKAKRKGHHPANLSPYATVVQYLFDVEGVKMMKYLSSGKPKIRIVIPVEVDLPGDVNPAKLKNAVFIGTTA